VANPLNPLFVALVVLFEVLWSKTESQKAAGINRSCISELYAPLFSYAHLQCHHRKASREICQLERLGMHGIPSGRSL
jgi:hypothetical protein